MDEGCLITMVTDAVCNACRRNFRRECTKAYHKCIAEEQYRDKQVLHVHCNFAIDGSEAEEGWQYAGVGKRR